jgi:hypothetical protein
VLGLRKDAGATPHRLLVFRDSHTQILDLIASNSSLTITPDLSYYRIINGARAKNSIGVFQRGIFIFIVLSRCQYKIRLTAAREISSLSKDNIALIRKKSKFSRFPLTGQAKNARDFVD